MKLSIVIRYPNGKSHHLTTTEPSFLLGRAGAVVIDDKGCSRFHAEVSVTLNGDIVIRDMASRNGTFLNGRRIAEATYQEGNWLRLGDTIVVLTRAEATNEVSQQGESVVTHSWPEKFRSLPPSEQGRFTPFIG